MDEIGQGSDGGEDESEALHLGWRVNEVVVFWGVVWRLRILRKQMVLLQKTRGLLVVQDVSAGRLPASEMLCASGAFDRNGTCLFIRGTEY